MILSIELTDTEYLATMKALRYASSMRRSGISDTDRLELLHLMTQLALAATKDTA